MLQECVLAKKKIVTQIPSPQNEVRTRFNRTHCIHSGNNKRPWSVTVVISVYTCGDSAGRWITQPFRTATQERTEWWIIVHTVIVDVGQLPERPCKHSITSTVNDGLTCNDNLISRWIIPFNIKTSYAGLQRCTVNDSWQKHSTAT